MLNIVDKKRGKNIHANYNEIFDIIYDLNLYFAEEMQENNSSTFYPLELITEGSEYIITFFGFQIFSTIDIELEYDEEKDEYEPLETFLIRECETVINMIKQIKRMLLCFGFYTLLRYFSFFLHCL